MDNKINNGLAEMVADLTKQLKLTSDIPSKKTSKELRKLDEKSIEQVLKSLNNLPTPEDRLAAMCKRYADVVEENRKLFTTGKTWEKKYVVTQREKEQLQLEYNKTVMLKAKLENLCRELQKQNKAVKDESLTKIKEEEERRKETQAKFQNTLSEITALMQQNNEKNSKLRDDNIDMTKKFKSVVEQYELREQQVDKMAKQMALEAQLADARLNKANLEAQAEREKMLAEKQQLLLDLQQFQSRCTDMQSTEKALRCQIAMYTDKYDEFQNAITKSNEVFVGFKAEMEKMSKQILKLEKETVLWKQRWEKSHAAVLDLAAEKQQRDATLALHKRQLLQLQRLCRTLQAERTACINLLKDNNLSIQITPVPLEPEVTPESVDRVDAMAANCAQLKQSLAQLQGQLNVLTSKKENGGESPPKVVEKPVVKEALPAPAQKSKGKKGKGKKGKQSDSSKDVVKVDNITKVQEPSADAEISTDLTESSKLLVSNVDEIVDKVLDIVNPTGYNNIEAAPENIEECKVSSTEENRLNTTEGTSPVTNSECVNDQNTPATNENITCSAVIPETDNIVEDTIEKTKEPKVVEETEKVDSSSNTDVKMSSIDVESNLQENGASASP